MTGHGTAPLYEGALFNRLRAGAGAAWDAYTGHEFVHRLGAGTLPEAAFRHFLIQDYLFLIHFSRAWALAAYKGETLADIRTAAGVLAAVSDTEMRLHIEFCRSWGLSEADMEAAPEADCCLAYTRYVLETGLRGDLLDLHVALAPCIVGYGEVGLTLGAPGAGGNGPLSNNPYRAWIDVYAGSEYQEVARSAVATLDDLWARRGSPARFAGVQKIFDEATRLEIGFWQTGLDAA